MRSLSVVSGAQVPATTAQAAEMTPAQAMAKAAECRTSQAPAAAPPNIDTIEDARLAHPLLLPPASEESAAMPTIVVVSTVVVFRSRSASFRTTALRTPMASPVRTMSA